MKKPLLLTLSFSLIIFSLSAQQPPQFFKGENGLWGLKNSSGKEIGVPKYSGGKKFTDGIAVVKTTTRIEDEFGGLPTTTHKYGYIDLKGKEITALKYDFGSGFKEECAAVQLNGKWGFINKDGKEIIAPKYDDVRSFSEGLAVVKLNDKFGYIDKKGKEVIPIKYTNAESFDSSGFATVYIGAVPFSIDKNGKLSEYGSYLPGIKKINSKTN